MLIAVPSEAPGGLDAVVSEHFGHCAVFTLVQVEGQEIGEVELVENQGHEQGGCLAPVSMLGEKGAEAMVAGGMGMRPLAGFQQAGITVYFKGDAGTVREAVQGVADGRLRVFGQQNTCGGGGGGCGHDHDHGDGCGHDHQHVEREVVDGPVEKNRVVFITFEVRDAADGKVIERQEGVGFVFGRGVFLPGLEKALGGHVAGDELEVTVPPEEGYGPRDDARVMKVPAKDLPPGLEPGQVVQANTPRGPVPLTLLSVEGDEALMDANHPLAGKTLDFTVQVLQVAEATEQDLASLPG